MRNKLINKINTLHDKLGLIVEKEYDYESISEFESVYSDILTYVAYMELLEKEYEEK